MPNSTLTEVIVLLDRSGSMSSVKTDMEGGYNAFRDDQKVQPGFCNLTLVQFDGQSIDTVYEAKPICEVPNLTFEPRGNTPLLDAMGDTINSVGKRLAATADDLRPGHVLFLVITDGHENASKRYSREMIKKMVEEQTNKWKWTFSFLGANVDAFAEGASLGIERGRSANFKHDSLGVTEALLAASASTRSMRGGGAYAYDEVARTKMAGTPAVVPDPLKPLVITSSEKKVPVPTP